MRLRIITIVPLLLATLSHTAAAQKSSLKLKDLFGIRDSAPAVESAQVTAQLKKAGNNQVDLSIKVEVPDDFYVYSTNRDYAGATVIDISNAAKLTPLGEFTPDRKPEAKYEKIINKTLEKFYNHVTWTRRYRIAPGTDPKSLFITGSVTGTYCTDGSKGSKCIPIRPPLEFHAALPGSQNGPVPPPVDRLAAAPSFKATPQQNSGKAKAENHPYTAKVQPERLGKPDPLQLEFALTPADAKPGETVDLTVTMTLDPKWHAYAQTQSEDGGLPTRFSVAAYGLEDVSGKFEPDTVPVTHHDEFVDVDLIYFEEFVTWTRRFKVAEGRPAGHYGATGDVTYQVCHDARGCLGPNTVEYKLGKIGDAPAVVDASPEQSTQGSSSAHNRARTNTPEEIAEMATYYNPDEPIHVDQAATTFWSALFGAFVGGILLNLMPCVFPVLGIKVMGFVQQAGSEPKKIRLHGLAFTAGLVVSMWFLAAFLLTLRETTSINWGQQMGEPIFVGAMILLLFVLGLNMAGIFEFGTSMTQVGGAVQGKTGYSGSFFSGILTTLIATPCSGPFLGAAMGYTLVQPAHIVIFLLTVFGLGIALPYLFLAFFPALINKLPRPGAWMETFKVTMAFALFATSAFFMQTFGQQTGASGLAWLTMAMVIIGLALYLYGRFGLPHIPLKARYIKGYGIPLLIASVGLWMTWDAMNQPTPKRVAQGEWENWHPGKVEYLIDKKKRIVWVDYTADW